MSENKDNHGFSVAVAQEIGVNRAIMLQHIRYLQINFLDKEESAKDVWIKRSRKALAATYPYFTEKEIRGCLDRLDRDEYIRAKVDNALNYDRTKSYQLAKKGWELMGDPPSDKRANREQKASDKRANGFDKRASHNMTKGPMNIGSCNSFVTSFVEGETPPKNLPTLEEEKKGKGFNGARAETREELHEKFGTGNPEISEFGHSLWKAVADQNAPPTPVGNYEPSSFDMYGIQPLEILEGDDIAEIEAAALKETNEVWDIIKKNSDPETAPVFSNNQDPAPCKNCEGYGKVVVLSEGYICHVCAGTGNAPPTHIVTEITEDPTIKIITGMNLSEPVTKTITFPAATPAQWLEASKEIQPIAKAATILEAEEKILNWAKTHGLETLKFRHITAKRKFVEDELPALVAHYVSVFASTNEGSRANLMRDPVANFEAGMFKYLTMQNTIDRNNATTKPGTQSQSPASVTIGAKQNQTRY